MSNFNVGIVFNAIDRASPVLGGVMSNLRRSFSTPTNATIGVNDRATPAIGGIMSRLRSAITANPIMATVGLAVAGTALSGLARSSSQTAMQFINPYMTLEDARVKLENTLMEKSGKVDKYFGAITREAVSMGDKLPGTTADFLQMASAMRALGVETKTIAEGGLKSAAYLANVLKIPYDQAAESVAKFKESMGIADKDLLPFIDNIQRIGHMGVKVEEMKYAFARSAGSMKGLGLQGLTAANQLAPLYGILIKMGLSGETVGTGVGNMLGNANTFEVDDSKKMRGLRSDLQEQGVVLDFIDDKGKFRGIDNFIKELEKFKLIKNEALRMKLLQDLFGKGGEGDMAQAFVSYGTKGIEVYKKQMEAQANLDKRVQNSLGTVSSLWEAFMGTKDNVFASVVETWTTEIHGLTEWLGKATSAVGAFAKENPTLTKTFGGLMVALPIIAGGLALVAFSTAGAMFTFSTLTPIVTTLGSAFMWLGRALITNPIGLILLAIAGAGYLIYTNWDKISGVLSDVSSWFSTLWSDMKKIEILGFKPFEALENGLSSLKKSALEAWDEVSKVFNFTNKSDESSVSIAKSDTQAPKFKVQAPQEHGIFRSVDIWASGLWNKFLGDIKKGWGEFTSGFFEGFDISSIKKDLEPLKTLFKTLESDFEPIGKKLGEHFETLAKHLGKLKSSALDAWGEVKKFFGAEDKTPTTDKVPKPKIQKVEIKTKGFFESISAGMTLKGIGKGIGTAFNLASRAISIGLGYVSKILLSLRNGAINAFNAISSGISKAGANIQSVWNGVFNWFSSKFAWLSGIFNRVSNFASSIASMGSNLLATPAPVMVGSGYQKALNNSSVVTRNIVRNPPSSVKNRSSVTNQNHYATTVHISNPANGFDIQKQVLKALKAHSEKNKNTYIKGR